MNSLAIVVPTPHFSQIYTYMNVFNAIIYLNPLTHTSLTNRHTLHLQTDTHFTYKRPIVH